MVSLLQGKKNCGFIVVYSIAEIPSLDVLAFVIRWDWKALREKIATHGVRNSLLVAPMPTASTSQILGNNEAFEPYTSNIYVR